jgi:hypothetical protein
MSFAGIDQHISSSLHDKEQGTLAKMGQARDYQVYVAANVAQGNDW